MNALKLSPARWAAVAVLVAISLALVSWDFRQEQYTDKQQSLKDTIPSDKKRDGKVRDLDEAIAELDRLDLEKELKHAMEEAARALKQVDMSKVHVEMEKALADINMAKIQLEVEASLNKLNLEKIQKDVEESMKKAELDLQQAMKSVDLARIREEVKASLQEVDWERIKKDLERVKEIDLRAAQEELRNAQKEIEKMEPELRKSLEEARIELDKAKAELQLYKDLVDGLDREGLLDKNSNYTIIHEDGKLRVNDREVSNAVYNKYRKLLDKKKQFRIKKSDDGFNINNNLD